jgi:hypothetical protein
MGQLIGDGTSHLCCACVDNVLALIDDHAHMLVRSCSPVGTSHLFVAVATGSGPEDVAESKRNDGT